MQFDVLSGRLTFDLHEDNNRKAEQYRNMVKRVLTTANTLSLNYSELWDLPMQEYLVLEEQAEKVIEKQKKDREELMKKYQN